MNTENIKKTVRDLFPMMPDFSTITTDWASRTEKAQAEYATWEQKAHEQMMTQIDEAMKLTRDSMSWGLEMSSNWRKQALEMVRRSEQSFATKA